MPSPETAEAERQVYQAYAKLTKMLLPSSGCFAIYAVDGDLAWCSDGYERPDLRVTVDEFRMRDTGVAANQGFVRETSGGVIALVGRLADLEGKLLGFVLIELGQSLTNAGKSMAASLTRPLISCLASQIALERPVAPPARASVAEDPRLRFLLSLGDIDLNAPSAVQRLLQRCIDRLDCLSAVFCIPDQDLSVTADGGKPEIRARLDASRKHLLAWVQLNNRPMVVNRVDAVKAPYKILSCPVVDHKLRSKGLIALFRAPNSANFELDDVWLIELLGRQTLALLTERLDPETGLMSRSAFERFLEERSPGRVEKSEGVLLHVSIENLECIQNTSGYAVADEAVVRTAQLIQRSLIPGEVACRLGCDRFLIFMPERDRDSVAAFGQEIAAAAADRHEPVSLSYGLTPAPSGAKSRHWIARAELASHRNPQKTDPNSYNAPELGRGK